MFTKPIEKLMVIATANAEVARKVCGFSDEEFGSSIFAKPLLHVRDAMRVALENEPYKLSNTSLKSYIHSLRIVPKERAAIESMCNTLATEYRPKEDDYLCITTLFGEHEQFAKEARAKALIHTNPYEAMRVLRELGYDDKRLDALKNAVAKQPRRMSTKEMLNDAKIVDRLPIVDGLVRRGEICNIVAAPKARKSYLMHDLAISLEHGLPWLGFPCAKSKVLIIDNELYVPTIKSRMRSIYDAKGLDPTGDLEIEYARGRGITIENVPSLVKGSNFDVIVLDALYRFFPPGFDENSNAAMTRLYNDLDAIASETGAAMFVVHHASKGGQSAKSVTDVGSGAGAQSRAADAHLILRPQKADGDSSKEETATLDIVCRSFAPRDKMFLKWGHPLWTRQDAPEVCYRDNKDVMTPEIVATKFFNDVWEQKAEIQNRAMEEGMSERTFYKFIDLASGRGLIESRKDSINKRKMQYRRCDRRLL